MNKNTEEKKKTIRKTGKGKVAKLQKKIEELEAKLAESEDKILRIRAEYDNYRKRSFRELADAKVAVKSDTLMPILNVFDHFKMAVDAADTSDDMNGIKQGMKMICTEFSKAMEEYGLEEVNALGAEFDPNFHEAVAEEESDAKENTVIKQWRCGYKLGSRLLRPASVVVSSGIKNFEEEGDE